MDFAVVKISGKQFKVAEGDTIEVAKLSDKQSLRSGELKDKKVKFEEVLLTSFGGKVQVGAPTVKGAKVTATILENKKGEKIRVSKFKSKVRYRRTSGFRPQLSVLRIEKIEF